MLNTLPLIILFIPLVGYLFLSLFYLTRYRQRLIDGRRLILEVAGVGLLFFLPAKIICWWITHSFPKIYRQWYEIIPLPLMGSVVVALSLALALAFILNRISAFVARLESDRWQWIDRGYLLLRSIEKYGNDLDRLVWEAYVNEEAVVITLDSGVVYIGYLDKPNIERRLDYLGIVPLKSGYNPNGYRRTIFELNHIDAFLAAEVEHKESDHRLIIPLSHVISISVFDPDFQKDVRLIEPEASPEAESPGDRWQHFLVKELLGGLNRWRARRYNNST